ncbi:MAG: GntR family transcriptional regulator [Bacteroidaceae bacterium]|nr:GntR family transcriptional regulator [Bacteroidaceae bacterium]
MIYQNERAIYVRIAERICDDILSGKYAEEERVPSVRELAAEYEVNTNTALRAFDILQRDGILAQQRGIGMLVERGARRRIRAARRKAFLEHDMPDFFRRLRLLGMTIDDVVEAWQAAEGQGTAP